VVVFKLSSYPFTKAHSGLVIKETVKQYQVTERNWSGDDFTGCKSSWRKEDCFTDINSASAALIARAERNIINKRTELDRAISALDVCKKWARQELLKLAATDKQQPQECNTAK
jgi:hypothetical protein